MIVRKKSGTFFWLLLGAGIVVYSYYISNRTSVPSNLAVEWVKIPPDAQERVMVLAEGGKIESLSTEAGDRNNVTVYRAEAMLPDGHDTIIKVEGTGKLVEFRHKDDQCETGKPPALAAPTR